MKLTRGMLNSLPKNGEDCDRCQVMRKQGAAFCSKCGKKLQQDGTLSGDQPSEK